MSKNDDSERFRNLVLCDAYATDADLGIAIAIILALGVVAAVAYGLYYLFS